MISHHHACIFVHIPKTGGSSIESVIWPQPRAVTDLWMGFIDNYNNKYQTGGLQHLLSRQIQSEVGSKIFKKYYKFTFVRNPWDKAVSQYCFMSRREDLRDFIGMKKNDSFKKYLDLIRLRDHVQWEPQVNFITDLNNELLVDYIGKFETINECSKKIFSQINITNRSLPHLNKTVRKPYQEYYDAESIEMIRELYAADITELGYSYE